MKFKKNYIIIYLYMQDNNKKRLEEIENFYRFNFKRTARSVGKKAKQVATYPKTGKVLGKVYKEAKSVSGNLNPINQFRKTFGGPSNIKWIVFGAAIILIAFVIIGKSMGFL